jgi:predicted transposase/invertase (TIGR01784 family)
MELKELTSEKLRDYCISEYKYEDFRNFTDYAEIKGKKKGRIEGMYFVTKKLKDKGMPVDEIAEITGLTLGQIQKNQIINNTSLKDINCN